MDQAALLLPDVERRIADPHLPADLFNPRPKLSLLQRKRGLPLRKLAPLHIMIPFLSKGKNHAGNSTFKWYELLEQRQRGLLRNSPLTSIKKGVVRYNTFSISEILQTGGLHFVL